MTESSENRGGAGLRRDEVARILGVSADRVTQIASEGRLHPRSGHVPGVKNGASIPIYDALEVCRLLLERGPSTPTKAPKTKAARAAAVYAMLRRGASQQEIVEALEIDPSEVRRLHAEYRTPLGQPVRVPETREEKEARAQKEHEERMRAMDEEDARRREDEERADRELRREWTERDRKRKRA